MDGYQTRRRHSQRSVASRPAHVAADILDISELALRQGVLPLERIEDLVLPAWQEEDVDEFIRLARGEAPQPG